MNIKNLAKKIWDYATHPKKFFKYVEYKRLHKNSKSMDDETYLKYAFKSNMGYELDLENPKTFSEKLQWLKLYDRRPEYTQMVDKYEAKEYVAKIIGEQYIISTLGVWDSFDDIDFNALPNQFVLKCTHDSGGLVICRDKYKIDKKSAKQRLNRSLNKNYFWLHREWPYKNVKPRIIAEQYMEDNSSPDLIDYKFYCFGGEPEFLYVSQGLSNHDTARISYLSLDWEREPFHRSDFAEFETLPQKPVTFDKMVEFARVLSKDIPFLRVDFYEINGQLYFSELTFFPGSGFTDFNPEKWDEILGQKINLPTAQK